MKIQYISDIHLEFYKDDFHFALEPSAPILCLVGDIGYPNNNNYRNFLKYCSNNFEKVFLISGNHEYYSKNTMSSINILIQNICESLPNVSFLNNKIEQYKGYTFIGCTLWSNIPKYVKKHDIKIFNDFKKTRPDNNYNLTIEIFNDLHKNDVKFLETSINSYENIICLTHYLPSFKMTHERYKNFEGNYLFASELDYLFAKNVKLWICGHSHSYKEEIINGINCVLNPFGYPDEHFRAENCLNKIISLDVTNVQ